MGPNLWRNRMLRQSATNGTKYRVRQILHKTTRTDINSRTLQAAVIVYLDFCNLKSTRNNNKRFLRYKISICLDRSYMYIVLKDAWPNHLVNMGYDTVMSFWHTTIHQSAFRPSQVSFTGISLMIVRLYVYSSPVENIPFV